DFIQHMADAGHHVCCGETNDMKAIAVQPFSAADVVQYLLRFSMSIAIHFDNQSNRQAAEIGKVWAEWKLPAEAMAVNCFAPKVAPEILLCF
ncbi:MAG TPA: hypothetical protein VLC74_12730, partial [Rhizomicrobium sp.]|nr:hypothetical protein [Rhizomicrobium sp.]